MQNLSLQSSSLNNLYLQHKIISMERLLLCKQCQHNVLRLEFNPSLINYRIQMDANFHMPDDCLVKSQPVVFGSTEAFSILLRLRNSTLIGKEFECTATTSSIQYKTVFVFRQRCLFMNSDKLAMTERQISNRVTDLNQQYSAMCSKWSLFSIVPAFHLKHFFCFI